MPGRISNLLKQKYEFDVKVEIESSTSTITAHLQCGDYGIIVL